MKKKLESNIISGKSELEIIAFKSQKEWERWLSKNPAKKPETRERRMKTIRDMLKKGKKFHE